MEIELILKVAGVGMIVAILCQVLGKIGREDQATMVSVAGIVIILLFLVDEISVLISTLREVFGL